MSTTEGTRAVPQPPGGEGEPAPPGGQAKPAPPGGQQGQTGGLSLVSAVSRRRPVHGRVLARDLLVAVTSVLFSLWVTFASGYQAVYQALVVVLAGIILYAVLNGRRERSGQIPQPADLPDDTAAQAPATAGPSPNGLDGPAPAATGKPPARPDQSQATHWMVATLGLRPADGRW